MSGASSKLYKEKIIDHYKHPRNFKKLRRPTFRFQAANSVCGDEVEVFLKEKKGKIAEVGFKGTGCAISVAGMSMLSEELIGKSVDEVEKMDSEYMLGLMGMESKSPRVKCATLGLSAVLRALSGEEDDPCEFC